MGLIGQAIMALAGAAAGQVRPTSRRRRGASSGWGGRLGEPRNAVLFAMATLVLVGGGRKLLQGWRARGSVGRLAEPDVTPDEIADSAAHGRAGLIELFRILGTSESELARTAAGRAIAVVWAQDNLIPEEEKGLVRRGFTVDWHARRRYPRELRSPIPIAATYGVPFLRAEGAGVRPLNLEWSHRILGAKRVHLEEFTPWSAGPGMAGFSLVPGDFETNGPHKIVLHAKVRTAGLTASWELDLPHIPFHFEFDPILKVDALLTLADDTRGEAISRSVRLESAPQGETAVYLNLNDDLAIRNPPALTVKIPLPCDLAHSLELEIEEIPGRVAAGAVILSGQGANRDEPASVRSFPLGPLAKIPSGAFDRPGTIRLRALLTADPDRGWADPDVRSIWPGTIATNWVEAEIVRR